MNSFRLITYLADDGPRAGLVLGDQVHDPASATGMSAYRSVQAILDNWSVARTALAEASRSLATQPGLPLASLQLLPPVYYPPAVYCAGINYADHIRAMAIKHNLEIPTDLKRDGSLPWHFLKASRCCVGPDATVALPSVQLDWEVELVAVIGRRARNVSAAEALDFVAGYTVGNDLSARDIAWRNEHPKDSPFHVSWLDAKSFEDSAPIGPWIVPAEEIGDPSNLRLGTSVNGVVKQDSSTSEMIFNLQDQIAYLSSRITLHPGDVIFTGTPAGAGAETGEFLKPGDKIEVWVEKIGALTTFIGHP